MTDLQNHLDPILSPFIQRLHSHAYLVTGSQIPIVHYLCQKIIHHLAPKTGNQDNSPDLFRTQMENRIDELYLDLESIKKSDLDIIKETCKYGPTQHPILSIWIKNAETMTLSAANSFLKLLEEAPQSVVFILSSHNPDSLLPTIVSRCQPIKTPLIASSFWKQYKETLSHTHQDPRYEQLPDRLFSYWSHSDPHLLEDYQPLSKILTYHWKDCKPFLAKFQEHRNGASMLILCWLEEAWSEFQSSKNPQQLSYCQTLAQHFQNHRYNINLKLHLDTLILDLFSIQSGARQDA